LKKICKIKNKALSLHQEIRTTTKTLTTMTRRYYYTVTINNANSTEFNTLAEAEAYKESYRQADGTYSYSNTNAQGKVFTIKANIEITKHWEYVNK
jgi:hypothetical protein